ncbi:MAG TPA: hypothetical protein IGR64_17050 [Leptolyngbyaceae cyanobacterium M65_K2018_010]|nr:hypothetical protein [Leptolyngbyaceae cyanobacterium M65_K2018_010]
MVISRETTVKGWMTAESQGEHPYEDLKNFQRLIDHLTADGRLARQDEDAIRAALVEGSAYSSEKCGLFRQLQERVWRAELHLEPW